MGGRTNQRKELKWLLFENRKSEYISAYIRGTCAYSYQIKVSMTIYMGRRANQRKVPNISFYDYLYGQESKSKKSTKMVAI